MLETSHYYDAVNIRLQRAEIGSGGLEDEMVKFAEISQAIGLRCSSARLTPTIFRGVTRALHFSSTNVHLSARSRMACTALAAKGLPAGVA